MRGCVVRLLSIYQLLVAVISVLLYLYTEPCK